LLWVFLRLALFLVALVALGVWIWRLIRTRTITALVCPRCQGRTALSPSRPDIYCRYCREPLRRGGAIAAGVATEAFRPAGERS